MEPKKTQRKLTTIFSADVQGYCPGPAILVLVRSDRKVLIIWFL